jgi:hypothetical protein
VIALVVAYTAGAQYRSHPVDIRGGYAVSVNPPAVGLRVTVQTFEVGSRTFKRVRFNGLPWEIYRCEPDGLDTYLGRERSLIRDTPGRTLLTLPRLVGAEPIPDRRA